MEVKQKDYLYNCKVIDKIIVNYDVCILQVENIKDTYSNTHIYINKEMRLLIHPK